MRASKKVLGLINACVFNDLDAEFWIFGLLLGIAWIFLANETVGELVYSIRPALNRFNGLLFEAAHICRLIRVFFPAST